MAILLQKAITELRSSRKQAETLAQQNQQLIDQNSDLAKTVKDILESPRSTGCKQSKPKIMVSVQTKVNVVGGLNHSIAIAIVGVQL